MTTNETKTEKDIIDLLMYADDLYYNGDSEGSFLTDEEYDNIKELAQQRFPNNPYFKSVGASVPEKAQKVKHDYILGSLKKFKPENISSWYKKYPSSTLYVIMPKLDGASIFATYEDGVLVKATTRGDGYEGFDITHKAKKFLPKKIKNKNRVDIRGECLLTKESALNLGFANPRNGVSGLLNKDGVENCEHVDVLVHEWINSSNELLTDDFSGLTEMGLPVVEYHLLSDLSPDELKAILVSMKIDYCYGLDGLVIAPINYVRENVERPEHKVAFKVNSEGVEAIVDYVEWNVSRTGRIVPLAVFKTPVPIDGTNVSKATCHNLKYVLENKIGVNAHVQIVKSGDIIPQIISVDIPSATWQNTPTKCPSCDSPLSTKGVDLVCTNKDCYEKFIGFVEYFFRTLGVENVSAQTFRNLGVSYLYEIFNLTVSDISKLEGFGDKKAETIVEEIKKSIVDVEPETFLAAIGLQNFGIKNTKKFINSLDKSLTSKEKFEKIFTITEGGFTNISGFGKSIFNSVIGGLGTINIIYTTCLMYGLTFNENKTLSEDTTESVKVTMTGKGPLPRKELEKILKERGYEVIDFTSETQILICDDLNSSSSKMKKAKKNGIKIVTYEEIL